MTAPQWTSVADGHRIVLRDDGILHIRVGKVWSAREADAFFGELIPIHREARRRAGRVLALVEVDRVQSPLVALSVRNQALAIKQPGDRTAMLVSTVLSKLQMGRLGSAQGFGLFSDRVAAQTWLTS